MAKDRVPPVVSVLMPVYNGEAYLAESISSILAQTYADFELIIINDGSTDSSSQVIQSFRDPRIRSYSQPNQGLPATLNRAIGLARGIYLARQDQDDVSLPDRFEKQVDLLERNPEYGIVGTWSSIRVGTQDTEYGHSHPLDNETLKFNLLFSTYFVHSSVMLRKAVFEKVGLYSTEKSRQPEDFELWSRVVRDGRFKVANIPERLIVYREVAGSMSRKYWLSYAERVLALCAENLAWASGRDITDSVVTDMAALIHRTPDKIVRMPDFCAIHDALLEAAKKVGGPAAVISLRNQVKERYKSIRNYYVKYRLRKLFGKWFDRSHRDPS